jgi:RED-like protein N-terminal region
MNNSQFRRLLDEVPPGSPQANGAIPLSSLRKNVSSTPVLGSRAHSSIPMTPRSIAGRSTSNDFARQVTEHNRATLNQGQLPAKKFRSSAAPKGTKLATGYQDRAALLRQQEQVGDTNSYSKQGQDDNAERIRALEEMVKLQQTDQATFENLRDEIGVGGDLGSTHLVKGLDRKLLGRVRRGEDIPMGDEVLATGGKLGGEPKTGNEKWQDIDEELESVLEKGVRVAQREDRVKKGEMTSAVEKLSRDQILRRLKASRASAVRERKKAQPVELSLGSKFRKVDGRDESERKKFVETVNGRRREVLIVPNPDGTSKRKVRWIDKQDPKPDGQESAAIGEALGMQVPAEIAAKQKAMLEKQRLEDVEDDDIFAGVGANYNPLGNATSESGNDSDSDTAGKVVALQEETEAKLAQDEEKSRNYFSSTALEEKMPDQKTTPAVDPTILAVLKRAAAIRKNQEQMGAREEASKTDTGPRGKDFLERLRKREREDAADLDLGFGESRFADEEDEDGAIWNGEEDRKNSGRKRGRKKRKGETDEVSDVMAVLDRGKK